MKECKLIAAILLICSSITYAQTIRYVNVNSPCTSGCDGTSWAKAFDHLQDALDIAQSGNHIWVAAGTYKPTTLPIDAASILGDVLTERNYTFHLIDGVSLYGGFDGTEVLISQRDIEQNETILSGDIGTPNNIIDNTYKVVMSINDSSNTRLDGFSIKYGNTSGGNLLSFAEGETLVLPGGAVHLHNSTIQITNCIFEGNISLFSGGTDGGIIFISYSSATYFLNNQFYDNSGRCITTFESSNITLDKIKIIDNDANPIYNYRSSTSLLHSEIRGNTSNFDLIFSNDDLSVFNCLIAGNKASSNGSVIRPYCATCNFTIQNSTITKNDCLFVIENRGTLDFVNNIVWDNSNNDIVNESGSTTSISHCILDDGLQDGNISYSSGTSDGGNNKDIDPQFVEPVPQCPSGLGDLHLRVISPAVNAGDNNYALSADLDGNIRILDGTVDIGCYEFIPCNSIIVNSQLFVDHTAVSGANAGSSWEDAYLNLSEALYYASCMNDVTIYVAEGTYKPDMFPLACQNCFNQQDYCFLLTNNVSIYGGFPSGGSRFSDRDPELYPTILSGEIGTANSFDNAYHIMIYAPDSPDNKAIIDGFTIEDGYGDTFSDIEINGYVISRDEGAAINIAAGSVTLENSKLYNNFGKQGGIRSFADTLLINNVDYNNSGQSLLIVDEYLEISNSKFENNVSQFGAIHVNNGAAAETIITNSIFINNEATGNNLGGGSLFINGSSTSNTRIDNCTFTDNIATGSPGSGGAIFIITDTQISNSIFKNNTAQFGGAIHNYSNGNLCEISNTLIVDNTSTGSGGAVSNLSDVILRNNTIANNIAALNGNGIYLGSGTSSLEAYNSILFNNSDEVFIDIGNTGTTTIDYSLIQGGYPGNNNIVADPEFVDISSCDYSLGVNSPCIDVGDNQLISQGSNFDLVGNDRVINDIVDLGAYESLQDCTHPDYGVLEVLFNSTDGPNWTNNTSWLQNCDPCTWYGITCNGGDRVINVDLQVNNLFGTLPQEITQLTELQGLQLGVNNITGLIPSGFGSLPNLQNLWLQLNDFSGTIPTDLGNSTSLQRIYLNNNSNLNGSIPSSFGDIASLLVLRTHNTSLTGCYDSNLDKLCMQLGTFSTNANMSDGTGLDAAWEDFCQCNAGICECNETNVWIGGNSAWDNPTNWSLGHLPLACEIVEIKTVGDVVSIPINYSSTIYLIDIAMDCELEIPTTSTLHVLADPGFSNWTSCN